MITIKKDSKKQWLMIDNEIEGKVYLEPDATHFGCAQAGPGAISASLYTYSFILPAWLRPKGHGIVFGLGSGAGIVMLLALFPNLTLTVVEINTAIIALVKQCFPLIQHYINQNRLIIINANANDFNSAHVDFTLIDIYGGNENHRPNLQLLPKVLEKSDYVAANLISYFSEHDRINLLNAYTGFMLFPCYDCSTRQPGNWILTNITHLPFDITQIELFPGVEKANKLFAQLLQHLPASCFY